MSFKSLWLFCLFLIFSTSSLWGSTSALETKLKAAYLYNFSKFVEWPQTAGKTIKICVLGDAGITKMLEDLSEKQGDKKEFSIHSISKSDIAECNMVYISGAERDIKTALERIKEHDILTVSDNDNFSEQGGIITLFPDNGKIRFSINLNAVKKTNLKISSKLLELAKTR